MIKFIIAQGIGFSPGSGRYLPTLGFSSTVVIPRWVRLREVVSPGDRRSVLAVTDQRGLASIGDRRGVQKLR